MSALFNIDNIKKSSLDTKKCFLVRSRLVLSDHPGVLHNNCCNIWEICKFQHVVVSAVVIMILLTRVFVWALLCGSKASGRPTWGG